MRHLFRLFLRLVVTLLFAAVFVCFVVSICIALFKATGVLIDGTMYFDFNTPSYWVLFFFQVACVPVLLGTAWLRNKLLPAAPSGGTQVPN